MTRFCHPTALELRNFKGVAELDLMFDDSLTLLAGVNGVGKTSVLEALLAGVTYVWHGISFPYPQFSIQEHVVHAASTDARIVLTLCLPNRSTRDFSLAVDEITRSPTASLRTIHQDLKEFEQSLPLVVYYDQNRVASPHSGRRVISFSANENRASSLDTAVSSSPEFKAWFFERETDEGLEIRDRDDLKYRDPELEAVRQLLGPLDGFTAIRSRKPPDRGERTLFLVKDGADIPFDSLSGGEQAFFLLAADLARRLMLESPGTPISEAPGIVCIDEIELHLHPAWQRKILGTLMETFPACQFVVTTHSPQVIGGVEAHHVRLLTLGENGIRKVSQPIASKGRDSNYVLKGILDTPERDDDVSRLFDEFDDHVDAGNLDDAELVLDKLGKAVEGESSRVAIRQAKWNRLRRAATK